MKRVVFLYSVALLCLVAERAAFAQPQAKPEARKACPFRIAGMWRMEGTTEMTRLFFDFSSEGYVTLLGHAPGTLPQDFEMIEAVNYKLDQPAAPKAIEFTTTRGNDAFGPGVTRMEIIEYSDDSFTTRGPASEQKTRWMREKTHRYFLTFAARPDPSQSGGPAFAMWTVLDGRKADREVLGVQWVKDQEGKTLSAFGPITTEIGDRIIEESDRDAKRKKEESAFMRVELSAAKYEITRRIYESWSKQVQTQALPYADAYLNGLEFLRQIAESLNQCGEPIKLLKLTPRERDEVIAKHQLPQYTLTYIRALRKQNDELHVNDVEFPWQWRPTIQVPGQ
jgi:hypothetical protein